MKVHMGVEL